MRARRPAPGSNPTSIVHPIVFILIEALIIGFFVFGYVLYRRRRSGPREDG